MQKTSTPQARQQLFNIHIDSITRAELLAKFDTGVLVTPNVDHMMLLQENDELKNAYKNAEFTVVDSQIVFWALKFLGRAVPEKISGSDLLPAYCEYHAKNTRKSLFILGGKPGVPEAAMAAINSKAGKRLVIGVHSPTMQFGPDGQENDTVIDIINASKATSLIIGLGCPKQEIWITRNRHRFTSATSFLAVGAAIDFEAGSQPRAPAWLSNMGLEWAYRLSQEPRRLWRRYFIRDPKFLLMVFKERIGLGNASQR
jgi:N-acetylglucosaminyldiphosphoundecaprenol N-acetyl-beta-D-mannosaminyltransferase